MLADSVSDWGGKAYMLQQQQPHHRWRGCWKETHHHHHHHHYQDLNLHLWSLLVFLDPLHTHHVRFHFTAVSHLDKLYCPKHGKNYQLYCHKHGKDYKWYCHKHCKNLKSKCWFFKAKEHGSADICLDKNNWPTINM